MPPFGKTDTTKATPYKKGDFKIEHNLYNLIGANLFKSFEEGKITRQQLDDIVKEFSIDADINLGKGYGVNLGYNVHSRRGSDDFRIKFTKDLKSEDW
tara:strand:+ start:94 stop:387 length:294 start_codon:yes stop_codon:yes gene_type:complete